MEGRLAPILSAVLTVRCSLFLSCLVANPNGCAENRLNNGGVKLDQQLLRQVELPELAQEVHPLRVLRERSTKAAARGTILEKRQNKQINRGSHLLCAPLSVHTLAVVVAVCLFVPHSATGYWTSSRTDHRPQDWRSYWEEINNLAENRKHLLLNVELMVDFRKRETKTHSPV